MKNHFNIFRWLIFVGAIVCLSQGFAQVIEDFEQEILATTPDQYDPAWVGDFGLFTLVDESGDKMLRSNTGTLASSRSYYLSTPNTSIENSSWEFFVNLKFATSGANYVECYLVADESDPAFVQNAYVLRMGETADRIVLYRLQTVTYTELLASPANLINSSTNNPFKIKVTRDDIGTWSLSYDKGATGSYLDVGTVFDNTITTTSDFILNIQQSTAASAINNHFFDDFFIGSDTQGPIISNVSAINTTSVDVKFDEPVDQTTAEDITHYGLNNGATISAATIDGSDPSLVHLTTSPLTNGLTYTLTVSNVEDLSQNVIAANSTVDFTYLIISIAGYRDVVINEFMVDGAPPIGLPETDFVELYNPTDMYFDLTAWTVGDNAGQSGPIGNFILAPDSYLIVCPTNFVSQFEAFGDTRGVSSFPNFNQTGTDQVILRNSTGTEMDRVSYTGGLPLDGITFEQVNPTLVCSGAFNFRASLAEIGGTPGAQNSVYLIVPDNFGPNVGGVRALTSDSIRIDFSEVINGTLVSFSNYVINPTVGISNTYYLPTYPSSVFLKLSNEITPNLLYTVIVSGISDCSANSIDQNEGTFILGGSPTATDIMLSEILFNPRTGGVDFVEIFNPSSTVNYELRGWKLARLVDGEIDSPKPIAADGQLIRTRDFLVFTSNPDNISIEYPGGNAEKYVQLSSLPSYNDDEGTVVLLNELDEIVQQFDYNEDFHYALLESEDGVSLERVSYEKELNDPNNWRSAASTVGFATPGRPNSQSKEFAAKSGKLTIDPKVFLPGNTGTGRDFTTINYQLNEGGQFANIMIYDQQGRPVKQLANGASLATEGFFRWDGTTDRGGMARMGYYLIVFELYSGTGKTQTLKETVVVGRDF